MCSYIAYNRIWVCHEVVAWIQIIALLKYKDIQVTHSNKWEIMTLSCFSSSPYNLAVVPFSRTNCFNQIIVCINSSGKATSKCVQKSIWPAAFPPKMGNSCLASDLCLLSSMARARPMAEVALAGATQFLLCGDILYSGSANIWNYTFFEIFFL